MNGTRPLVVVLGLSALLAPSASAQFGAFVLAGQPIGLLDRPEVQKDVNLDEEQIKKSKAATQATMARYMESGKKAKELYDAGKFKLEESKAEREKIASDYRKELATFLKPGQMKRLREITIQMYSTAVFQDPDLLDELKLTAEQRAKLVAIEKDATKERLEISRGMHVNVPLIRKEVAARAEALRKREMAQMLSVLNEAQMAQWKAMQGPPLRRSVK